MEDILKAFSRVWSKAHNRDISSDFFLGHSTRVALESRLSPVNFLKSFNSGASRGFLLYRTIFPCFVNDFLSFHKPIHQFYDVDKT